MVKPAIVTPTGGERLRVAGDTVRVLADAEVTDGTYELFELTATEGCGPPLHSHPWAEAYWMLEGEMDVEAGTGQPRLSPGSFIHVPARSLHTFRVVSKRARFLVLTSPTGATAFFRELDRETGGDSTALPKILAVAARHGFEVRMS